MEFPHARPRPPREQCRDTLGKVAVLSDIHGNLHALDAVLAECARREVERFFCLGDIVSYGAFPVECLAKIRALRCPTVLGNHDLCVATDTISPNLNPLAIAGICYSLSQLSEDDRAWLASLPLVATEGDATLVHASLCEPGEWHYVSDAHSAKASMRQQQTDVCFYGHTHVPQMFALDGLLPPRRLGPLQFRLEHEGCAMLNPGSVGQPRNGVPEAQFVLYEPVDNTIEFVQVAYDVEAAGRAIRDAGLPERLAERLRYGL